ncbi:hypothetical protein YC2023_003774 [Brassica napus]
MAFPAGYGLCGQAVVSHGLFGLFGRVMDCVLPRLHYEAKSRLSHGQVVAKLFIGDSLFGLAVCIMVSLVGVEPDHQDGRINLGRVLSISRMQADLDCELSHLDRGLALVPRTKSAPCIVAASVGASEIGSTNGNLLIHGKGNYLYPKLANALADSLSSLLSVLSLLKSLFVFHKSKNFTSDYEIRMPPTACFEHSNFFKVTAPEARPGQLRPGAYRRQKRQADRCSPKADRATHPKYTRTSVCVRQHTQDVRGRPSAHTGRPAVHQYTYQHAPWTVRVILAHVGCLFSTHRTSVSTRRTSVAVRVCPCVRQCTQDVRQHTQDVRQHTQDVRGCPCVSVCPSVHTGRPSAHTGRPSAHAGRPSAHAGRPWLSVCVRVSVSAHRTSVSTHRTSVSTRRTSVAVRVCPCVRQHTQDVRQHTQDVRQHTQDVRAYPLAHTDCPWTDPCTELISAC